MSATIRVWFLQGEQSGPSDALGNLLRQWAGRPENSSWSIDCFCGKPDMGTLVQAHQPDVLLAADPSCLAGSWLSEVLEQGVGVVATTSLERASTLLPLADRYPVQLVPAPGGIEELGLALLNAVAALRRQRGLQSRIDQLQQRLNDRILIERAKGILVERLNISEKEAYQRLRLQSRRQRRPIRDIAQCLLDAQTLFSPETNGLGLPPSSLCQPLLDRPSEKISPNTDRM